MNFSDSEIVLSILSDFGYNESGDIDNSDVILLNTCSIRENAETKVYTRLGQLQKYKKRNPNLVVGILGCMAERLRKKLIDELKIVDIIVGPDEYRRVPELIDNVVFNGEKGIAVQLSRVETYDDILPVRKQGITAWLSIMRGCDKFCTFCVVPFTRGRERSRNYKNILNEAVRLRDEGVKDVWLLGQNVNSYKYDEVDFADLLELTARELPDMRIRYTTSHPYDCSVKLLETMAKYDNICKYIHLPIQSGSDRVLQEMNRLYSVDHYMSVMKKAREMMPGVGLSTDIISSFPSETEDEHKMTLVVINEVRYDSAFTFVYSRRENTKAYRMPDDIDAETKKRRLDEIISLQRKISFEIHKELIGKEMDVLVESLSKKSDEQFMGRTDCNKPVIIPKEMSFVNEEGELMSKKSFEIGDMVKVKINKVNSATLFGEPVLEEVRI
ncbi:MAG: tRNA (N6-isopentenyl adenosine(37)-C2)-methylthiotransferase MiaB [Ignavibacteriae bacterium]|nr:tRNA (N6-isopentenyl adenosine(37)-C2)-methylthiotransferase MiaB [Ignavibacteriota bacterium]MCB9243434.1 tRNA (N6-isopentenyl adenosine(37)-C2)-methylthiotransferase MiaB [Ignavibacteriales bacterium]